jgi:hypothetical protein
MLIELRKNLPSSKHRRIDPMKLRHFYLALCIFGFLLPYSQLVPWVSEHGFDPSGFVHDLFANRISGFFGLDVIVSAIVLCLFVCAEGLRLGMGRLWLPIVATCLVGVSLGLPLFLYLRQIHLDNADEQKLPELRAQKN